MTLDARSASNTVYLKTAQGRAEMASRALGLGGRQRNVLVMVDGRKTAAELAACMAPGVVEGVLAELAALGLVAPEGQAAAAPPSAPGPASAPQPSARLAQAKARMTSVAETCLGLMAAEIVRRIERAGDEAALLGVLGHWHMALQDSKHGKAIALAHVEEIRASLAGG